MAGYDDDIQRFAHDNAVFHDIIQHYDDTAYPDHDDINYYPASLDDLDGAEYDNDGNVVSPIGDIGGVIINLSDLLGDIADAIERFGSFDDIPDDYEFDADEDDDDTTCGFIVFLDYFRDPPDCSRNNPYKAPGDDDNDPGHSAA